MTDPRHSAAAFRQIGVLHDSGSMAGLGDGDLLARFGGGPGEGAEAAFSALVERHGPMVLRVCRSGLRDPHDADDAFQATFLVLARRAASLRVADSLGPWLHGVACRVSAGARTSGRRRARLAAEVAGARRLEATPRDDLGPALHEEIDRLPPRFREAVVLCHLEGLTHEEAADRLACPVGTVRSRLARGRDRLRRALARRGLAPAKAHEDSTSPAVPFALVVAATRAALDVPPMGLLARLLAPPSQGVLAMMSAHPIKIVALLGLVAGGLACGLNATAGRERPPAPSSPAEGRAADGAAHQIPEEGRFAAMEGRIRDLERKIEAIQAPKAALRPVGGDAPPLRRVRPRVDDALAGRVYVSPGQVVKKGDPLVEIRSIELARSKNAHQAAFVRWDHDRKYLEARRALAKEGRITAMVWAETQNDEKRSRLEYLFSGQRLTDLGLSDPEIDKLLANFGDDFHTKGSPPADELRDLSTITITAPVDGRVTEVGVEPGNYYSVKDVMVIIEVARP